MIGKIVSKSVGKQFTTFVGVLAASGQAHRILNFLPLRRANLQILRKTDTKGHCGGRVVERRRYGITSRKR